MSRWEPLLALALFASPVAAADPKPLAGWPGVYPPLPGYAVRFEAPVVGKDRTKEYRQTAHYEWTGGDIRTLAVTLTRAANFKQSPEKAERVEIAKRPGWYADGVLTIRLGEDRVIQLRGGGSLNRDAVIALAARFNLDRVAKATESPPRTDARRSLESFRSVTKDMTFAELASWVGDADADVGSGIHIMAYKLPEGGRVLVGTPDFVKLLYVKHETSDGKTTDLLGK